MIKSLEVQNVNEREEEKEKEGVNRSQFQFEERKLPCEEGDNSRVRATDKEIHPTAAVPALSTMLERIRLIMLTAACQRISERNILFVSRLHRLRR